MGVLDFAATPHRMAMASSAANPSVVMRTAVSCDDPGGRV